MADDKKTGCVKVWLSEPLELELHRLAARDDRKLSEYIGLVLRRHVFGHVALTGSDSEGPNRGE
jgi:cytidylate kinase